MASDTTVRILRETFLLRVNDWILWHCFTKDLKNCLCDLGITTLDKNVNQAIVENSKMQTLQAAVSLSRSTVINVDKWTQMMDWSNGHLLLTANNLKQRKRKSHMHKHTI